MLEFTPEDLTAIGQDLLLEATTGSAITEVLLRSAGSRERKARKKSGSAASVEGSEKDSGISEKDEGWSETTSTVSERESVSETGKNCKENKEIRTKEKEKKKRKKKGSVSVMDAIKEYLSLMGSLQQTEDQETSDPVEQETEQGAESYPKERTDHVDDVSDDVESETESEEEAVKDGEVPKQSEQVVDTVKKVVLETRNQGKCKDSERNSEPVVGVSGTPARKQHTVSLPEVNTDSNLGPPHRGLGDKQEELCSDSAYSQKQSRASTEDNIFEKLEASDDVEITMEERVEVKEEKSADPSAFKFALPKLFQKLKGFRFPTAAEIKVEPEDEQTTHEPKDASATDKQEDASTTDKPEDASAMDKQGVTGATDKVEDIGTVAEQEVAPTTDNSQDTHPRDKPEKFSRATDDKAAETDTSTAECEEKPDDAANTNVDAPAVVTKCVDEGSATSANAIEPGHVLAEKLHETGTESEAVYNKRPSSQDSDAQCPKKPKFNQTLVRRRRRFVSTYRHSKRAKLSRQWSSVQKGPQNPSRKPVEPVECRQPENVTMAASDTGNGNEKLTGSETRTGNAGGIAKDVIPAHQLISTHEKGVVTSNTSDASALKKNPTQAEERLRETRAPVLPAQVHYFGQGVAYVMPPGGSSAPKANPQEDSDSDESDSDDKTDSDSDESSIESEKESAENAANSTGLENVSEKRAMSPPKAGLPLAKQTGAVSSPSTADQTVTSGPVGVKLAARGMCSSSGTARERASSGRDADRDTGTAGVSEQTFSVRWEEKEIGHVVRIKTEPNDDEVSHPSATTQSASEVETASQHIKTEPSERVAATGNGSSVSEVKTEAGDCIRLASGPFRHNCKTASAIIDGWLYLHDDCPTSGAESSDDENEAQDGAGVHSVSRSATTTTEDHMSGNPTSASLGNSQDPSPHVGPSGYINIEPEPAEQLVPREILELLASAAGDDDDTGKYCAAHSLQLCTAGQGNALHPSVSSSRVHPFGGPFLPPPLHRDVVCMERLTEFGVFVRALRTRFGEGQQTGCPIVFGFQLDV